MKHGLSAVVIRSDGGGSGKSLRITSTFPSSSPSCVFRDTLGSMPRLLFFFPQIGLPDLQFRFGPLFSKKHFLRSLYCDFPLWHLHLCCSTLRFQVIPWQTHCTWRRKGTGGRPGSLGRGAGGRRELTPCRRLLRALLGHHLQHTVEGLWYWPGGEFIYASSPRPLKATRVAQKPAPKAETKWQGKLSVAGWGRADIGLWMKRALVFCFMMCWAVCP